MKLIIAPITLAFFASINCHNPIHAQTESGNINKTITIDSISSKAIGLSNFDGWTDNQFQQLSDSLYNSLYAPVTLVENTQKQKTVPSGPINRFEGDSLVIIPPDIIDMDFSNAIFTIDVNSESTPTGAKIYTVPLNLCPGINGFEPSISLVYNSQSASGIMGIGWTLTGLSTIERTTKNIYYDNTVSGISGNPDDSFLLDGMRLLPVKKELNKILYETERGSIKVTANTQGNNISSFEVFYPNGVNASYKQVKSGQNAVIYRIHIMTDLNGNSVSYSYKTTDETISKISYNDVTIDFNYTSREDLVKIFSGGKNYDLNTLLSSISIKKSNTEVGKYSFTYRTKNDISCLRKIDYTECGKSYQPLTFAYGKNYSASSFNKSMTNLLRYYNTDDRNRIKAMTGKFDYDNGTEGLLIYPNNNPYWESNQDGWRFENKFDGTEEILLYGALMDDFNDPLPSIPTNQGFVDILCADIYGNQQDYIIKVNNNVVNQQEDLTFTVYGRNAYSGIGKYYTRSFTLPTAIKETSQWSVQPKHYFTGDFNGDGKIEIMAISVNAPWGHGDRPSVCYIFDIVNNKILFQESILTFNEEFVGVRQNDPEAAYNNSDKILILDYDGDGKSDICHINSDGTYIYTLNVSNGGITGYDRKSTGITNLGNIANREVVMGDYNGDGLMDMAISPSSKNTTDKKWSFHYSRGDGTFQYEIKSFVTNSGSEYFGFLAHDINGDGKTDIINYRNNNFTYYFSRNFPDANKNIQSNYDSKTIIIPINLNSHNLSAELCCISGGNLTKYSYPVDERTDMLVTAMGKGHGVYEYIDYKYISPDKQQNDTNSGASTFYTKGSGAVFPYVNIAEKIPVLSASSVQVSGKLVNRLNYTYKNAVIHRQGLGFCGFEKIETEDEYGYKLTREYDPYRFGVLTKETSPYAVTTYTNTVYVDDNKVVKTTIDKKEETNLLSGGETVSEFDYDIYGNVISETITYHDGIIKDKSFSYADNPIHGKGYYHGFLIDSYVKTTREDDTYEEETEIEGDALMQPLTEINYINGHQTNKKEFSYDSKGNRIKEAVTLFSSSDKLINTIQYNESGQTIKETDFYGFSKEYSYDNYGRILSVKDNRNNYTWYKYSPDGYSDRVEYPDSTSSTVYVVKSSNPRLNSGIYEKIEIATGKPKKIISYDAMGREIRTGIERFNGKIQYTDKEYDYYGRLVKESLPYENKSSRLWTNYEYDRYGRTINIEEPSGNNISFSYSGFSVTKYADVVTKKTYDSVELLSKVEDPGGGLEFGRYAGGEPYTIMAHGGIGSHFGYDEFRRRIYYFDPGHGAMTYQYDSSGNIKIEKKPNDMTTTYTYDSYNRIIQKSTPHLTTDYSYNQYGDLVSVESDNGTSTTNEYDEFGRLTAVRETGLDNTWLDKEYEYASGNIHKVTYKFGTGKQLTEEYVYTHGHLTEVKVDGETSVYKLVKENSLGQPTEVLTGPLTRNYSYNDYGMPTKRSVIHTSTSKEIQNLEYVYDIETSNMISRKDNGVLETFTYDSSNRLTQCLSSSVSYGYYGNISSKSDVGSYSYENFYKPYSVTEIEPINGSVASDERVLTYTAANRIKKIKEDDKTATFDYNVYDKRVRMEYGPFLNPILTRYYLGDCYEKDESAFSLKEKLYILGDYYRSPVVMTFKNNKSEIAYILRDCLGSITHVVKSDGSIIESLSYDAWGRPVNAVTKNPIDVKSTGFTYLGRGYTGHEHIPELGLINMNGRLYDCQIARFLSADPQLQMPDFSPNYNRYSYALNNPLKYTDPSGEFLFLAIAAISDLFKNIARHGLHFKDYDFTKTKNAWKIDMGMFKGNFGQVLNKFTYNKTNSLVGNIMAQGYNLFGHRGEVTYLDGIVALSNQLDNSAVTIGHYTVGPNNYKADWRDHLFVHEYGHYIQSQIMGTSYLSFVAIPSGLSIDATSPLMGMTHDDRWFERSASKLGAKHFDKKYGSKAIGYNENGPNYFNINVFKNGGTSLYVNPRTGKFYQGPNLTEHTKFNIFDFITIIL